MHLLGLVKSVDHVCARYRLAAYRPLLAPAGCHLDLYPWPKSWLMRWWLPRPVHDADVVIVQRRLLSALDLGNLRRAARRLIFDFDDAIFWHNSYAPAGLASATRQRGFARMAQAADLVVAGNDFLAENAAAVVGPDKIRVLPSCVNPALYSLADHHRVGGEVRLVWIGSASTLQGLKLSEPLWDEIGRCCPGVSLRLICDRSVALGRLPVAFRNWATATETGDLADADIGISWLPDDPWSWGKCGLKVLQYMAAGLPVVANAVGVQADLVRHGETGYLVKTPDEWCAAIARLAADPELRRRFGQEGRRAVEARYSVSRGVAGWTAILEELAGLPARVEVPV
jgi:glycosyltransferase involved in cell wall biosynthesis